MSKIDRVVVMCHKGDLHYAETSIASIRHWNKEIPLFLHKDEARGAFDTRHIEKAFNVSICDNSKSCAGNFLSPLLYILQGPDTKPGERILVHDSDILWLGDVIPVFEKSAKPFIVQGQTPRKASDVSKENPLAHLLHFEASIESEVSKLYFDPQLWHQKTSVALPEMVFNAGHYVIEIGALTMDDFSDLIYEENGQWKTIAGIELGDQGATNFAVARKKLNGEFKVESMAFSIWPREEHEWMNISQLPKPAMVHWAGLMHKSTRRVVGGHLWRYYRNIYFQQTAKTPLRYFAWIAKDSWLYIDQELRNIRLRILGKGQFIR